MRETTYRYLILVFAFVAMAIAIAVQLRFINDMNESKRNVVGKSAIVSELTKMRSELEKIEAAKEALKKSTNSIPIPLSELVGRTIKNAKPDDSRLVRRQINEEWILHEQEIVFSDVDFADVFSLFADAGSVNPPWQLKTCMLKAGNRKPGAGKAVLNFVALEYKRK